MSPYRDGDPGLRRSQRRAAGGALVRGHLRRRAPRSRPRPRGRVRGRLLRDLHAAPRRLRAGRRARAAGRARARDRPHVPRDAQAARPRARRRAADRARAGGPGARRRRRRRHAHRGRRGGRRRSSSCCPRCTRSGCARSASRGAGRTRSATASGDDRGLTDAGRALVRACEELGILVDLSHLSERGFWDVAEIDAAPAGRHPRLRRRAGRRIRATSPTRQLDAVRRVGRRGRRLLPPRVRRSAARPTSRATSTTSRHGSGPSTSRSAPTSTAPRCRRASAARRTSRWCSTTSAGASRSCGSLASENFLRVLRQVQNAASSRAMPTGSS